MFRAQTYHFVCVHVFHSIAKRGHLGPYKMTPGLGARAPHSIGFIPRKIIAECLSGLVFIFAQRRELDRSQPGHPQHLPWLR